MKNLLASINQPVELPPSLALLDDVGIEDEIGTACADKVNKIELELMAAETALNNLMEVSEIADAASIKTPETANLYRMFAAREVSTIIDDAEAITVTAGLEADDADVGLLAFSTLKEYAVKIIAWVQARFKELMDWAQSSLNKHFGSVERLKGEWLKVLKSVKERADDYELTGDKDFELTKGADAFYFEDKLVDVKGLVSGVTRFKTVIDILTSKTMKNDIPELAVADVIVDGKVASSAAISKSSGLESILKDLSVIAVSSVGKKAPAKFVKAKCSKPMLGRSTLYVATPPTDLDPLEMINAVRVDIDDLKADQKPIEKVKLPYLTLAEVEKLADTNIETLDALIELQRGKHFDKVLAGLAKASKALDAWKAGSDLETTTEERAAYRDGVRIATANFSTIRQALVTMPSEMVKRVKFVSTMHRSYANKSLSAHSKKTEK